jgi:RNase P subunit RPR2
MIDCAYCEHPLICETCRTPYVPPTREHYEALSQADVAVECPECGVILVCHWCKTQYDGLEGQEREGSDSPRA